MALYKQLVVNCSILMLSMELIFCASVYSNIKDASNSELLCNQQSEKYIHENGKESSLTLDLHPGMTHESCKRVFIAPESHGFFIKLHKISGKKNYSNNNKRIEGNDKLKWNSTGSCPLSIYTITDLNLPPWRIDPCQLEARGGTEEVVRLLQGRLRLVWNHGGNISPYKLSLTVLGRGLPCQETNKHPCLTFGEETLLCISKDLLCDGIRNCPTGIEYFSDEDAEMCANRKLNSELKTDLNIWQHLSMQIIKNLFVQEKEFNEDSHPNMTTLIDETISTEVEIDFNKNNRTSLTRGLSRYGPWGYLMLGMLLCGGALLICGLWECCCRRNKPERTEDDLQNNTTEQPSPIQDCTPPNYEELDPPPSYSALFPAQKLNQTDETLTQVNEDVANNSESR